MSSSSSSRMFYRTKNICLIAFWVIVAINVVYFVHRWLFSDNCNVESLMKDQVSDDRAQQSTGRHNGSNCVAVVSGDTAHTTNSRYCMYTDEVHLRLIILTFKRHESLLRLLSSINDLELDGDSVAIEIWIDRDINNKVHPETLAAANSFQWKHGNVAVHVQLQHAGIYGQWINTWRPWNASTKEMALILEDDVSVSPFAYRWLRAARRFYANRTDIAGFTLQSEGLIVATNGRTFSDLPSAADGAAYLYELMGSWGFAPRADVWIGFQDWFASVYSTSGDSSLKPYVPGLVMTSWYKSFEKQKKAGSMWTMWFIYYYSQVRHGLYTVYSNIRQVAKNSTAGQAVCVAVNRREPGLHYSGKPTDNTKFLLRTWKKEFEAFSHNPVVYSFDGQRIKVK